MSTRILLQTILKLQDQIKTGAANFMDVSAEYFKSTGNFLDDSQKAVALEEINKIAPSNVTTLEGVDAVETILPTRGPNVQKAGEMSDTPFTDKVKKDQGIESLRGDETFGELMEKMGPPDDRPFVVKDFNKNLDGLSFARFGRAYKNLDIDEKDSILATMKKIGDEVFGTKEEGLGSLYPKGKPGEIFDEANSKREEMAGFMKAMRAAGIKNEDVMKTAKITYVAEGKRAATSLARAADMAADTKVKQEFLSELDEKIADKGPRFFNEEYQGFDSYGALINNEGKRIRNAIYDDLEEMGVDEDTISRIIRSANEVAERSPYEPEAFMTSIKDDLEINEINYNTDFWDNYISKILELSIKPEPRFADGGLV